MISHEGIGCGDPLNGRVKFFKEFTGYPLLHD